MTWEVAVAEVNKDIEQLVRMFEKKPTSYSPTLLALRVLLAKERIAIRKRYAQETQGVAA